MSKIKNATTDIKKVIDKQVMSQSSPYINDLRKANLSFSETVPTEIRGMFKKAWSKKKGTAKRRQQQKKKKVYSTKKFATWFKSRYKRNPTTADIKKAKSLGMIK